MAVAVILAASPDSGFCQEDAASTPQTIFFKANAAYHDGAYEQALRDYERLLSSGIESGNIYFNLGNAYFKLGDIGQAIGNYELAERLMPTDPDLAANLAYARSLTGAEPCEVPLWQRAAFPLRGSLSSTSLTWLLCGFWTLTFLALVIHRFVRRQTRFLPYVAVGLGFLTVIVSMSLAAQLVVDEWPRQAVVVGVREAAARFEPAQDGTVHFSLPEGSKVEVTEEREGWLQVARCDGRRGWVPSNALDLL
jgi:tetratricopeptide (TPR) repeat protein